jgi:hypothetical protein
MRYRMSVRALAIVVALSLGASVPVANAVPDEKPGRKLPAVQQEKSVPGKDRQVPAAPENEIAKKAITAVEAPRWPTPGRIQVDLARPAAARSVVTAGRSAKAATGTGKVDVEVLDVAAAQAAGVAGVLVKVSSGDASGPVSVGLDYSGFASAFGGDYGQRLRFTRLPACALVTPDKPECRTGTPVGSTNSAKDKRLTAEVDLRAASDTDGRSAERGSATDAVVLAATTTPEGGGGDYKATSLTPAGAWTAGGSGGAFSYSYPLRVPPMYGGQGPSVGLGYSSGAVDGRTSATNNQASWVGDGWDMWPGYVERRYKSCAEDLGGSNGQTKTGDLCYATDNATLMIDGSSTELVKGEAGWKLKDDDGSKIERLTGAVNGDNDGEYWKLTKTDGTQYFLGMNRLPGWTAGNAETKSAWTVPVFGNNTGEPCAQATFDASWCQRAYRWNLDYIIDPRGNVTTYSYEQEINHYARNLNLANTTPYVRGGWLKQMSYGLRGDDLFAQPPAWVSLDVAERCIVTPTFACQPSGCAV